MIVTSRWQRVKFWFITKVLCRPYVSYRYRYTTSIGPDTQIRLHEEVK